MARLNITVANKVATYSKRGGEIVCGNSDYEIEFAFDSEWDTHEEKTARFIWGGKFYDVTFTGTVCAVPVVRDTNEITVGVYAGDLHTTTPARVPCERSILCKKLPAQPEFDKDFASEAQKAADKATGSATVAQEAATRSEEAATRSEEAATRSEEALANVKLLDAGNLYANALRRDVAGAAVALLTDVSPVPHEVNCRVSVQDTNLITHPSEDTEKNVNGLHIMHKEDGSIVANGYCTKNVSFDLGSVYLDGNSTYYVSGCPSGGSMSTYRINMYSNDAMYSVQEMGEGAVIQNIPEQGLDITGTYQVSVVINGSQNFKNLVFKPRISIVSDVKVMTCGKNLFDVSKITSKKSTGNYYLTNNQDGSVTVTLEASYSVSTNQTLRELAPGLVVGQTYVLNAKTTGTTKQFYLNGSNGAPKFNWYFGKPAVMTEDMLNARVYFYASGGGTEAVISDIQIELGQTATDYEPYMSYGEYAADENGVVNIPSASPYMTIVPSEGEVSVSYNRDLVAVIARIESVLAGLDTTTASLLGL